MRRFRVNVNGNEYDITLEEVDATAAMSAPAPKAESKKVADASVPSGTTAVNSPMPGTILKVNVNNGDTVKSGQVLMILEAMKMENEIMAPCDGKVTSVNVSQGASVESGAVLCTIG